MSPAVNRSITIAMDNRRRPGRPLSFDREAALHRAMLLFWRHGYEGTSVDALTAAMGITPPSLYAAFGDKRRLFDEAVRRYLSGPVVPGDATGEAPITRTAMAEMLRAAAERFTGTDTPAGCLVAHAAISCSAAAADVQATLAALRREIEARLHDRIAAAAAASALPPDTDAGTLAGYLMAVIQGMATLARDGAPRDALLRVAEMALRAWPGGGV